MARNKELKVRRFLSTTGRDGPYKPWEECTKEEIELFAKATAEKLSRKLSAYYSAHPDEYAKLLLDLGEMTQEEYDEYMSG